MSCVQKRVAWTLFFSHFLLLQNLAAQPNECAFSILFQPVFSNQKVVLDEPFLDEKGDTSIISTLKFYVGNFVFLKKGQPVFSEKSHRLIDLEMEKSLVLRFQIPEKLDFDSLRFDLGVDSLTHLSGAMCDDLDPTRGMFWTWQSGYINFKMEGFSSRSTARNKAFEFHLGGFLVPFQTVQKVILPVFSAEKMRVDFDLESFFESVDWAKKSAIMSPSGEAVRLSAVLAKAFRTHEN